MNQVITGVNHLLRINLAEYVQHAFVFMCLQVCNWIFNGTSIIYSGSMFARSYFPLNSVVLQGMAAIGAVITADGCVP